MPHLGISAIDNMAALIEEIRTSVSPEIAKRISSLPVTPIESRCGTLNINSIQGGQPDCGSQSPCVADRCEAIYERRWVPEETFFEVREQILAAIGRVTARYEGSSFELQDYGNTVHPTATSPATELVTTLQQSIYEVTGQASELVASPGTYDHKHFARIGQIPQCVAYGPGTLEQAHQPDEWCAVDAIVQSAKVIAVAGAQLVGRIDFC
jgi:succinyl-diaminopimelate desuccinylase